MSIASRTAERLLAAIEGRGWCSSLVPVVHLAEVRETLEAARRAGDLDESFYAIELEPRFAWEPPDDLKDARSAVVVTQPAPAYLVSFAWQGRMHAVTVPPTYLGYMTARDVMLSVVAEALAPDGYRVAYARLPQKTLAVRSGLARWGRNNIAYFPGMGTFAQPVVGWTDLPAHEDLWSEPLALERCATCTACETACPTGAIGDDRFLLYGERCLTHLNEWEGDFPAWLDPLSHNALVGCMKCQTCCPENSHVLGNVVGAGITFEEDETALLVADTPYDALPDETAAKVDALDILIEYGLICRNLRAVLGIVLPDRRSPTR